MRVKAPRHPPKAAGRLGRGAERPLPTRRGWRPLAGGRLASPFTAREVYRQEWTGLTEPRVASRPVPRRPEAPAVASATTRPVRSGGLLRKSRRRARARFSSCRVGHRPRTRPRRDLSVTWPSQGTFPRSHRSARGPALTTFWPSKQRRHEGNGVRPTTTGAKQPGQHVVTVGSVQRRRVQQVQLGI